MLTISDQTAYPRPAIGGRLLLADHSQRRFDARLVSLSYRHAMSLLNLANRHATMMLLAVSGYT